MPSKKIIIDTDPGIDDILGLLLALSAKAEEVEILLISLTFGNIEVRSCLRNVISMFHIIEREMLWRRQQGRPEGFETLRACPPIVAVGAEDPLEDQKMLGDYFHGVDGLGGIHASHPHLTPKETWEHMFDPSADPSIIQPVPTGDTSSPSALAHRTFIPSKRRAHEEILRVLRENDPDTVTLVAVGPLTNLALASAADPETFLRVKEVVVMGGTVNKPGNVGPSRSSSMHPVPPRVLTSPGHASRRVQRIRRRLCGCASLRPDLAVAEEHHAARHQSARVPRQAQPAAHAAAIPSEHHNASRNDPRPVSGGRRGVAGGRVAAGGVGVGVYRAHVPDDRAAAPGSRGRRRRSQPARPGVCVVRDDGRRPPVAAISDVPGGYSNRDHRAVDAGYVCHRSAEPAPHRRRRGTFERPWAVAELQGGQPYLAHGRLAGREGFRRDAPPTGVRVRACGSRDEGMNRCKEGFVSTVLLFKGWWRGGI